MIGYVGTYTTDRSKGLYRFSWDNGKFGNVDLFANVANPKYVAVGGGRVAALADFPSGSGVALFSHDGKLLDHIAYEKATGCFLSWIGNHLYAANYHEGTFSLLTVQDDRLQLDRNVLVKKGCGCHQVLLHDGKLWVPCLFLDEVRIYTPQGDECGRIRFPQGSGPRHGVFSPDGRYLYMVSELSNELFAVDVQGKKVVASISVLPGGKTHLKDTAAIRMSGDGKRVYVSTRTQDILSVLAVDGPSLSLEQTVRCGKHPRDFILWENHLLVAERDSDRLVSYALRDGCIDHQEDSVTVPEGIAVVMEEQS